MLATGRTSMELWVDLLKEGQKRANIALSEMEEGYTIAMLERHTRNANLIGITLATEYLESQSKSRTERQGILSSVADIGLILAGLFPERAKRKNVPVSYFTGMSQICFFELSGICETRRRFQEAREYHEIGMHAEVLAYVLFCMRRNNTTVREILPF
jgi:hypothetical protein